MDQDQEADREDLAEDRTNLAEDRTVLANERTYAGWLRTGFACVGIGLGFQALFIRMEPWWVPRLIATIFLLLGMFIAFAAERRACAVLKRLQVHEVKAFNHGRLRTMTIAASVGILATVAAMWLLPISPPG